MGCLVWWSRRGPVCQPTRSSSSASGPARRPCPGGAAAGCRSRPSALRRPLQPPDEPRATGRPRAERLEPVAQVAIVGHDQHGGRGLLAPAYPISSTSERMTASPVRAPLYRTVSPGGDALAAQATLGGAIEDEIDGDRGGDDAAQPADDRGRGRSTRPLPGSGREQVGPVHEESVRRGHGVLRLGWGPCDASYASGGPPATIGPCPSCCSSTSTVWSIADRIPCPGSRLSWPPVPPPVTTSSTSRTTRCTTGRTTSRASAPWARRSRPTGSSVVPGDGTPHPRPRARHPSRAGRRRRWPRA